MARKLSRRFGVFKIPKRCSALAIAFGILPAFPTSGGLLESAVGYNIRSAPNHARLRERAALTRGCNPVLDGDARYCGRKRPRSERVQPSFMAAHKDGRAGTVTASPPRHPSADAAVASAAVATAAIGQEEHADAASQAKEAPRGLRMITDASIRRVFAATSLTALVGDHIELRPAGSGMVGRCPFHQERTPSFNVDESRGLYHCFGCGAGGNAAKFIMEVEGLSFYKAVHELAARAGVALDYEGGGSGGGGKSGGGGRGAEKRELLTHVLGTAAQFYARCLKERPAAGGARAHLRGRGISAATCNAFQVGYSPLTDGDSPVVEHLIQKGFDLSTLVEAGIVANSSAWNNQYRSSGGGETVVSSPRPLRRVDRFRGRLIIPIRDHRGTVIGFGGRDLGVVPAAVEKPLAAETVAAAAAVPAAAAATRAARSAAIKAALATARAEAVAAAAEGAAPERTEAAAATAWAAIQSSSAVAAAAAVEATAAAAAAAAAAAPPAAAGSAHGRDVAKYLNSPETPVFKKGRHVFGLDLAKEAIRSENFAILVEGYFDVIALHEAGVRNVLGILGTAITAEQLQLAARHCASRRLVLNMDADEAGARAIERLCADGSGAGGFSGGDGLPGQAMLDVLGEAGVEVRVATLPPDPDCKDPADYIRKHGAQSYRDRVLAASKPWTEWYGDRILAVSEAAGAGTDPAAFKKCVGRATTFLSGLASQSERTLHAYRFASMLSRGSEQLRLQLESDLVAEAEGKARRRQGLMRRVNDQVGAAAAAAAASMAAAGRTAATAAGGSEACVGSDPQKPHVVARRMAAGGPTQGRDAAPAPSRGGRGRGRGGDSSGVAGSGDYGSGGGAYDDEDVRVWATAGSSSKQWFGGSGGVKRWGSAGKGPDDAGLRKPLPYQVEEGLQRPGRDGEAAGGGARRRGRGRRHGGGAAGWEATWEPLDPDLVAAPTDAEARRHAERYLLALMVHDVFHRDVCQYAVSRRPLFFTTPQRQWLFESLMALDGDLKRADAPAILEYFRGVAPPGFFAAVSGGGVTNADTYDDGGGGRGRGGGISDKTGASEEDAAAALATAEVATAAATAATAAAASGINEQLDYLFQPPELPAAPRSLTEIELQEVLLVICKAEATNDFARLTRQLNRAVAYKYSLVQGSSAAATAAAATAAAALTPSTGLTAMQEDGSAAEIPLSAGPQDENAAAEVTAEMAATVPVAAAETALAVETAAMAAASSYPAADADAAAAATAAAASAAAIEVAAADGIVRTLQEKVLAKQAHLEELEARRQHFAERRQAECAKQAQARAVAAVMAAGPAGEAAGGGGGWGGKLRVAAHAADRVQVRAAAMTAMAAAAGGNIAMEDEGLSFFAASIIAAEDAKGVNTSPEEWQVLAEGLGGSEKSAAAAAAALAAAAAATAATSWEDEIEERRLTDEFYASGGTDGPFDEEDDDSYSGGDGSAIDGDASTGDDGTVEGGGLNNENHVGKKGANGSGGGQNGFAGTVPDSRLSDFGATLAASSGLNGTGAYHRNKAGVNRVATAEEITLLAAEPTAAEGSRKISLMLVDLHEPAADHPIVSAPRLSASRSPAHGHGGGGRGNGGEEEDAVSCLEGAFLTVEQPPSEHTMESSGVVDRQAAAVRLGRSRAAGERMMAAAAIAGRGANRPEYSTDWDREAEKVWSGTGGHGGLGGRHGLNGA